jgi:peptidoglycan/xylan/chitin deacetylase (PgdA/CDA1 family)
VSLSPAPPPVNVCFHGIGQPRRELEPGEEQYWVSQTLFESVLDLAVGKLNVNFSFDDGNRSDVRIGLPALLARNMTADFYLIAGRLGEAGSLDETDSQELVRAGMTIGSHGLTHKPWRTLPSKALADELDSARQILSETTGMEIDRVALPLGSYDRRVLRSLRQRNYIKVMTSDRTYASSSSWMQPRFSIRSGDTVESVSEILAPRNWSIRHLGARARITLKTLR